MKLHDRQRQAQQKEVYKNKNSKRYFILFVTILLMVTIATFGFFHNNLNSSWPRLIRSSISHPPANGTKLPQTTAAAHAVRKKVVYSCAGGPCGGWADRQKGIVGAYVLASLLNRDFTVNVISPCDLRWFMSPNKVNWTVNASEINGPSVKSYYYMDHSGVNFIKGVLKNSNLDEKLTHDVIVMTLNMEVVQYLRQHALASHVTWMAGKTVPEIYRQALNDLFTLSPDLQQQMKVFTKSRPAETRLVCAQVRLGRHNSFADTELIHTVKEFPVLVDFLAKYNDSQSYRMLITSDSREIIEMAGREFPEVLLSIPGPITHTDKTKGKDACDGFRKAILDEYALSTCDILVISESGLGKIASFLRGSDQELYLFHNVKIEPFTMEGKFPNRNW